MTFTESTGETVMDGTVQELFDDGNGTDPIHYQTKIATSGYL